MDYSAGSFVYGLITWFKELLTFLEPGEVFHSFDFGLYPLVEI